MVRYDHDIAQIKEKIINQILLASAVISILALASVWLRDIYFVNLFMIAQTISVLVISIFAIFRKRLPLKIKALVVAGVVFVIFSFDLYTFGFLASAKVFLIIIPVLISFLYSYKKSLFVLVLYVIVYILFGYLHINGILLHEIGQTNYVLDPKTWLTDGLVLFLCSFSLLYVGKNFYEELLNAIDLKISSEKKYKEIFEKANDAITLLKDGKFYDCNQRTYDIFQYNLGELIGKQVCNISPDYQQDGQWSAKKAGQLIMLAEQGVPQQFEWQHKKSNGVLFDLSVSLSRIELHDGVYVLGILRDITEKKKRDSELEMHRNHLERLVSEKTSELEIALEEWKSASEDLVEKNKIIEKQNSVLKTTIHRLKLTQAQLIQSEKMASLGVLTAGVAHEVNNPLQYLSWAISGLNSYFTKYGSNEKETTSILLSSVNTAISRITEIVKGLNQFSRNGTSLYEDCHIHTIIDNCLAILHNQYKYKIKIVKQYNSDPIVIKGNVGKLHQVFTNILTNSIQSIENEGRILIRTYWREKKAIIEFIDNGCGISEENLTKICDPFFTTKSPGEGTGLGLSISYSIVQEHNGNILFKSVKGKWTKAIISFPAMELTNEECHGKDTLC